MSLVTDFIEPYKFWLELALAAALFAAGAASGNAARGHWDAGDIAKANAKAQAASDNRDKWKSAAEVFEQAAEEQNKATAQAQADAAHDAVLATQAIEHAASAEQDYLRKRRAIDAAAVHDAGAPCASTKIQGSPLE